MSRVCEGSEAAGVYDFAFQRGGRRTRCMLSILCSDVWHLHADNIRPRRHCLGSLHQEAGNVWKTWGLRISSWVKKKGFQFSQPVGNLIFCMERFCEERRSSDFLHRVLESAARVLTVGPVSLGAGIGCLAHYFWWVCSCSSEQQS